MSESCDCCPCCNGDGGPCCENCPCCADCPNRAKKASGTGRDGSD